MSAPLNTAIRAARNAGDVIIRYVDRIDTLKIGTKQHNDFVSEVDQLAEKEIIYTLQKAYPDHAIMAEESGAHNMQHGDGHPTWIIDPLDGTTNFLHGFPQFAVSIAMKQDNQLQVAVVYDPMRQELFTAARGAGARLNDRRIRMNPNTKLEGSLIGTGFPYYRYDYLDQYMDILKEIIIKTAGVRRPGSAALDLAYTAAGRFDGFWEFNLKPWDIAAGALLVQEAGGIVSDFENNHDYLKSGNIICGCPRVHQELYEIIQRRLSSQ
jgi:myo-inositol-1(or 4)-monophosphatase